MAEVKLVMPKMGESVMEATILTWLKKSGDAIAQDESVLEVATDKVDTEIPSTHAGVLKEVLAREGDVVQVGHPIAVIATTDGAKLASGAEASPPVAEAPAASAVSTTVSRAPASEGVSSKPAPPASRFYSPLVKTMAKAENIPLAELDAVPGTGRGGRLTKRDMQIYLKRRRPTSGATPSPNALPPTNTLAISTEPGDEIIQMDRMRKIIATRMVDSKRISPHVTSFVEADVTPLVRWRKKFKRIFTQREKQPLTYTPVFVSAVVKAIRDFPLINVQVDDDRIIKKKDIHIGIAVALPSGNLIVPVIKHADRYNLNGLVKQVNRLVSKARENRLHPDELAGGTFTLSNVGSFGNVMGTPIIMQPQVGILAVGAIQKKPAVIDTPSGDAIAVRHKMFLSHSYDHRVVDGALGGMWVRRVADYLEKFDTTQTI